MEIHGKQIIGHASSVDGPAEDQAVNPTTGERLLPLFHRATEGEVHKAVSLAGDAFEELRAMVPGSRAAFLVKIAEEIEGIGADLIERCHRESGLPVSRLESEVGRTVGQLRMFAELVRDGGWVDARIDPAMPEREPLPRADIRRMLIPIGPVVVFSASNFPLAFSTAGVDPASALAAGNPVIVKGHHAHPGTAELVGRAVQAAAKKTGMPPGIFSLLHGPGREVGMALVTHPGVRAVGFTGSQAGGRALFDAAASRPVPIPVYAEMASINPVFILPSALAKKSERLVSILHQSVTMGVGQFCTNPGVLVLRQSPEARNLVDKLARLLADTPAAVMLHPGIRAAYGKGLARLEKTVNVKLVGRGEGDAGPGKCHASGALFETTAKSFLADDTMKEEVFGPCILAVLCSSADEMREVAGSFEGELTASVHGKEEELLDSADLVAILETRVGRLVFNGVPTGVEVCPAMNHGGPYPATTDVHFTSVGTAAIYRFARPVCYQNCPDRRLPDELKNANPLGIWRTVNGRLSREAL
ncbi:MAG: aldehyde dehydrogenase (NADP(+)) [Deltaproteobacteria bacterium]|nr:aldehyde dehydrogenase (NADP(+)) [Deltaproteobacteria bacterium]